MGNLDAGKEFARALIVMMILKARGAGLPPPPAGPREVSSLPP